MNSNGEIMKIKYKLFSTLLFAGSIMNSQAPAFEDSKCSIENPNGNQELNCDESKKLMHQMLNSNQIEAIHERYFQDSIQMEMMFEGHGSGNSKK